MTLLYVGGVTILFYGCSKSVNCIYNMMKLFNTQQFLFCFVSEAFFYFAFPCCGMHVPYAVRGFFLMRIAFLPRSMRHICGSDSLYCLLVS
jgi:hypothetical protein